MLNISIMNVVWTVINLLILYVVFRLLLFKRVDAVLQKRREEIEHATDEAVKKEKEAEDLKESYAKKLQEAGKECDEMISKSKKDGYDEYDRIINEAKEKAEQIIVEAKHNAQIEAQREKDAYVSELTDLVVHAANKIAVSKHDEETDKELYNKFIFEAIEKSE
ncbi:ATP synthase F0 subunit B [Butyrivibrio sp. FC2001]|uniref:ATP synthase F0 subunit B n=1 Tax=Butyrivibrio sp. FC2001 TaxID=1280671 RepID=UPI000425DD38|nr:ATP synthase F0 subunit B [Butyrivibrio sp. FC2001]MCR5342810.1 ATP synthase F0 subunit B [Butyrivibrio sp.]